MNKEDIVNLIEKDNWMMNVLRIVKKLGLPDWWIGSGFVRSKIWDTLHSYKQRTPIPDIDVIYFDKNDFSKKEANKVTTKQEINYENILKSQFPEINWSVTNQVRMHLFHNDLPYKTSQEALAQWVETATCIGMKLDRNNKIILATPRGIHDLVNLILRPTSTAYKDFSTFKNRIKKKKWIKKWPKLKIVPCRN